jgi:hypothetical protein
MTRKPTAHICGRGSPFRKIHSPFIFKTHFSLLMPLEESHFTINYHYITPKDYQFIKEKVSDEIIILDDVPENMNLESSDDEEPMDVDIRFCVSHK